MDWLTGNITKFLCGECHLARTDAERGRRDHHKSAIHKSHGLKVTSQRIEMMNKLNFTGANVNIIDLKDEQGKAMGTKVELVIPF